MENLFGIKDETIRTLGFYQPFGSLMLHGKIETRWVRAGKKPPFPLGRYLLYATQKKCDNGTLFDWCGPEIMSNIIDVLRDEPTKKLYGHALCLATLVTVQPMRQKNEKEAFVKYRGSIIKVDDKGVQHLYHQVLLYFAFVQRVNPFPYKGKQGVGIYNGNIMMPNDQGR